MERFLSWLVAKLEQWIGDDWSPLMEARRSVAIIMLASAVIGIFLGRAWAAYLARDESLWRLSNYTLKQRTIEISSSLQEFAANQMMSQSGAGERDFGRVSMKNRAQYAKRYRATAIQLREVLQSRVCGNYKPGQNRQTLDVEYDVGLSAVEVAANLQGMADNLCWYRSIIPRFEAMVLP